MNWDFVIVSSVKFSPRGRLKLGEAKNATVLWEHSHLASSQTLRFLPLYPPLIPFNHLCKAMKGYHYFYAACRVSEQPDPTAPSPYDDIVCERPILIVIFGYRTFQKYTSENYMYRPWVLFSVLLIAKFCLNGLTYFLI